MREGVGERDSRRKGRVSEPAPREIICFVVNGWAATKESARSSMALVRT